MRALITGATKGIGRAIAHRLAQEGYDLALVARSMIGLKELKTALESEFEGIEVITQSVDLSKKFEVGVAVQSVQNHWKRIDVLVNNAGLYAEGSLFDEEDGRLEAMMKTNVYSAYALIRGLVPAMIEAKQGYVFNICSVLSKEPRREAASYTLSKFALLGLSKTLAAEVRDHGVKVTAILPGSTNTPSWDGLEVPRERFVQPEDVAELLAQTLKLSGGAWLEEITVRPLGRGL